MELTEKQPHTKAYLEKRRLTIVLPAIIIPFLTILFWLFGGGTEEAPQQQVQAKGINTEIPGAKNTADSTLDKMAFYRIAEKDSAERANNDRRDPNLDQFGNNYGIETAGDNSGLPGYTPLPGVNGNRYTGISYND